jgi:hypothetical protein
MSGLSDLVSEAIEHGARSLDDPSQEQILTALRRGRVRRRIRQAILSIGVILFVTGLAVPVAFLSGLRPPSGTVATPTPASSPSIGPSVVPPAGTTPLPNEPTLFVPATHREGESVVMPVTFPDGTTAEIRYPPGLKLAEMGVAPNTYGDLGGYCGGNLLVRPYDAKGEIFEGEAPLAVFEGAEGRRVGLWPGAKGWPSDYLVFQFGGWQVLVPCIPSSERARDEAAQWAALLGGHETAEGFLVLSSAPPLVLAGDADGPELFFGVGDQFLTFEVARECSGEDVYRAADYARWCLSDGARWLTIKSYGDDSSFTNAVIEGLQVGNPRVAEDS